MKNNNIPELVGMALFAGLILLIAVVTTIIGQYIQAPFHVSRSIMWGVVILLELMIVLEAIHTFSKTSPPDEGGVPVEIAYAAKSGNPDDDADRIRGMINTENGYINNRVTWMITFESLLFTGLGLGLSNSMTQPILAANLERAFAFAGVLVAVASMWGMCGATCAIFELRLWHYLKHPRYEGAPMIGLDPPFWPRPDDKPPVLTPFYRFGWFITIWNILPIAFVFAWLMVLHFVQGFSITSAIVGMINAILLLVVFALSMTTKWPNAFATAMAVNNVGGTTKH